MISLPPSPVRCAAAGLLLAASALLPGCAQPLPATQTAQAEGPACVQVTGSSICRKEGSGNANPASAVSGEELRKTVAPITGAAMGRTGN